MATAASPASPSELWRPRYSPWLITISVLLATFMEVLDTSIANVSLPHIAGSLSATTEESTWVLTSYLVSNAIILCAAGWLSRYFGRKRYLAYSVLLFTLSSMLCGMAHSLPFLVFARILQGLGGGGLQPVAQAILLESFPPEERGAAMAAYGMGIVVAPIIGPTLGGWITDNFSWRWIFYINIPIGMVGFAMQQMFLEDPPYMRKAEGMKIDYVGFGLMTLTIGLLQIILDKGQQSDWFDAPWICWSAVVVVLSLAGFIFWELRHKEPIVNLRILKNRNFAIGTSLMTALGGVLYGSTVMLPIFMQGLLAYTAFQSGLAMTPRGIGSFFSMVLIGRLMRVVENRSPHHHGLPRHRRHLLRPEPPDAGDLDGERVLAARLERPGHGLRLRPHDDAVGLHPAAGPDLPVHRALQPHAEHRRGGGHLPRRRPAVAPLADAPDHPRRPRERPTTPPSGSTWRA